VVVECKGRAGSTLELSLAQHARTPLAGRLTCAARRIVLTERACVLVHSPSALQDPAPPHLPTSSLPRPLVPSSTLGALAGRSMPPGTTARGPDARAAGLEGDGRAQDRAVGSSPPTSNDGRLSGAIRAPCSTSKGACAQLLAAHGLSTKIWRHRAHDGLLALAASSDLARALCGGLSGFAVILDAFRSCCATAQLLVSIQQPSEPPSSLLARLALLAFDTSLEASARPSYFF